MAVCSPASNVNRCTSTDSDRLRRVMRYTHQHKDLRLVGWRGDSPENLRLGRSPMRTSRPTTMPV
eukprot:2736427-Alexandrium_andersonii.AAC.1